jgi:rhodanese-related sulfurtransferase
MFNFFNRKTAIATITADELQQRLAQGDKLTLLDVREPAEYAEAHLKGSRLIPLDQLSVRLGDIPTDRPVIAVCRSGNRSGVAADLLQRAGYTNVLNLTGGMLDWTRRGLPVQRGR